jgi:hypothetical protein
MNRSDGEVVDKPKKQNLERRKSMKRFTWVQICILFFVCIGVAVWTTHSSGQAKDAAAVEKEMGDVMPLLKGQQWQKLDPNSKVAFIWGAAHVILLEHVLMENIPELRRENFSAKVVEARAARVKAGTAMTINETISAIDQYYKEHPDQLETPVLTVIWNTIKPSLKTGIAGRPLK